MLTTALSNAQQPERWYKVIASGSGMWDSSYNIFITQLPGTDSIVLTGFTNHGATVKGVIMNGRINIPKQTVTITPYGARGGSFTSVAEGEGSITDSLLALRFYYKQDTFGHTAGLITAIRWSSEIDAANAQLQKQAAKALHASRTRDTVIDGEKYRWIVYDDKHMMVEIGQSYENEVKNGQWLYTDDYGRLDNIHRYIDGVLNGWTISYSYQEYDVQRRFFCLRSYPKRYIIHRSQGLYVDGKHVGKWTHYEAPYRKKKKGPWKMIAFDNYDLEGNIVSKARTYATGEPYIETFYSKTGAIVWYINYDKKGKVVHEGKHQPLILLEH
jgi:hypothetical protein